MDAIVASREYAEVGAAVSVRKVSVIAGFTDMEHAIAAARLGDVFGHRKVFDTAESGHSENEKR